MTTSRIAVSYNNRLRELEELVQDITRVGDFFAQGSLECPLPKLQIDGIGTISFPVPNQQAKALVKLCDRAPYGRGQDTLIDTDVRKVWQLAPSSVHLSGKTWQRTLDDILAAVSKGLGLENNKMNAEPYKLLVYDRGSFFKPHRDSEKTDGMIGTLLIMLPSAHTGGELIIRHAGREKTLDISSADVSELAFAAFYADCEHEVLPVTRGFRVCLVYNLILKRAPPKRNAPESLKVPDARAHLSAVTEQLRRAFHGAKAPSKLVWLFEHQYSSAGLAFAALKHADAARASVLCEAAALSSCVAHLGIVHIAETGPAEYSDHHWSKGRSRRHRWYDLDDDSDEMDDDRDEIDADNDEFEIVEIHDDWCYVDQWVTTEEHHAGFGAIPIGEQEILPVGALDQEKPDEQRIVEATGNEGVSFERAYHRAAIVIWPENHTVDVLLQAGIADALGYLDERIGKWIASDAPVPEKLLLQGDAKRIVAEWTRRRHANRDAPYGSTYDEEDTTTALYDDWISEEQDGEGQDLIEGNEWEDEWARDDEGRVNDYSFPGGSHRPPDRSRMVALAGVLGDAPLLENFIRLVLTQEFDGSESLRLAETIPLLGPKRAEQLLKTIAQQRMNFAPEGCVMLLRHLTELPRESATEQETWLGTARGTASAIIEALQVNQETSVRGEPINERQSIKRKRMTEGTLANLLECLTKLDSQRIRAAATRAIVSDSKTFDARRTIVPALRELVERGIAVIGDKECERLWVHASEALLGSAGQPPEPPQDWRQALHTDCKCPDCKELETFARDPVAQIHRFRVRKDRRRHLHAQINRFNLDMIHTTERTGSPQTLVCEKTHRSYERKCAVYREDIVALGVLKDLSGSQSRVLVDLTRRISVALQLAAESPKVPVV